MNEKEVCMEEIQMLMRHEEKYYTCHDYMIHERPSHLEQAHRALQNLVQECAMLVTDCHSSSSKDDKRPLDNLEASFCQKASSSSSLNVDSSPRSVGAKTHLLQRSSSSMLSDDDGWMETKESFTFWRHQLYDWACRVLDVYRMNRDILSKGLQCLDRYLACILLTKTKITRTIHRQEYQLYFVTCFYLAMKISSNIKKIGINTILEITKYTRAQVEDTERHVLETLEWHVHPPTALEYTYLFWNLLQHSNKSYYISSQWYDTCAAFTELAVADSFFVSCRQSTIALAAVLLSIRLHGMYADACIDQLLFSLKGIISTDHTNAEFRSVYLQLEKIFPKW